MPKYHPSDDGKIIDGRTVVWIDPSRRGAAGSPDQDADGDDAAVSRTADPANGAKPGSPGGTEDGEFEIALTLVAAGGTPMAHEKVRVVDPATNKTVGAVGVTDADGVYRARVPAEKEYHLVLASEAPGEEDPSPLGDPLGGHERVEEEHSTLSVELLDAGGAPLKGEKVQVKPGQGDAFEAVSDDDGCIHRLAEPGTYQLTVRGKTFKAHTIFHSDREGTDIPYRIVVK